MAHTAAVVDGTANGGRLAEGVGRDGFALLRGLLPVHDVVAVRQQVLQLCHDHGWLLDGTALDAGMAAEHIRGVSPVLGVGISRSAYQSLQRLEAFHRLGHHPALLAAVAEVTGAAPLVHPQKIARVMLPASENAPTPPHQDYIFVQGALDTFTCWVPLGDCPRELGTLSLLPGSHRLGLLPTKPARGAGKRRVLLPSPGAAGEPRWCDWDLRAGDVVVFHSMAVHRSLPNRTGRVRLSADYRYQSTADPICDDALHPHGHILEWSQIYAGWQREELQYYWRRSELQVTARDASLLSTIDDD